jgi:glucose/arabinose dehydrogenase
MNRTKWVLVGLSLAVIGALVALKALTVGPVSQEPLASLVGPEPLLPAPRRGVPTLRFSKATGWPPDRTPTAPPGFTVTRFACDLDHPRWLYQLPNGDVLVAEASTVPPPTRSIRGYIEGRLAMRAGSQKASANRITLLRDADADGLADQRSVFLQDLRQPFGMVLLGDQLYVAVTDGLLRYDYQAGAEQIAAPARRVITLPAGGYNNHWTRNVVASASGSKLYVSVGSGSDFGEHGIENEQQRANILELDPDGGGLRVFASGLRNPNGMAWAPGTGELWTVVNERDMLGNDLVPDYLTRVRDGGFYGWPYAYWGKHLDPRVSQERPDLVETSLTPDYSLGAHVGALGLAFGDKSAFPEAYQSGVFISEHGSWNRNPFAGYKVVYLEFREGRPVGLPQDFLTGFLSEEAPGSAYGRPVGVIVAQDGSLLVADDVGNCVWRVTG